MFPATALGWGLDDAAGTPLCTDVWVVVVPVGAVQPTAAIERAHAPLLRSIRCVCMSSLVVESLAHAIRNDGADGTCRLLDGYVLHFFAKGGINWRPVVGSQSGVGNSSCHGDGGGTRARTAGRR